VNKLNKYNVKQVKLDFCPTESWLKTRKKIKDSKCENCGKLHVDCDGEIALATIECRVNAHLCKTCGDYFITKGAMDMNKNIIKNMNIKEKLIKQANRIAPSNNCGYKKTSELSVDELRKRISSDIRDERKIFHKFLEYPHLKILKEFVDAVNSEDARYQITYLDAFKSTPDVLFEYDSDDNYEHHRWCSYFDATIKVGDKIFSYQWANASGDNDLEDAGFDINNVWSSMSVVEPQKPLENLEDLCIAFGEHLLTTSFNKDNLPFIANNFIKER